MVDVFMELYVDWRERCAALDAAYAAWASAPSSSERVTAFEQYSRALDDEERAACRFGDFTTHAAQLLAV
jgi:hypothetical protein